MDYLDKELLNEDSDIFNFNETSVELKDDVFFHLYINQSPCGDASIFIVNSQDDCYQRIQEKRNLAGVKRKDNSKDSSFVKNKKFSQRTGAKVVTTSKIRDERGEGISYHTKDILRTKPGRVML